MPEQMSDYSELRYTGSNPALTVDPWRLARPEVETAADPFVGSGDVASFSKLMGKRGIASDFLNFPTVLAEQQWRIASASLTGQSSEGY